MCKYFKFSFLTAIFAVAMFSCGDDDPVAQDTQVSISRIDGVKVPVAGEIPVSAFVR